MFQTTNQMINIPEIKSTYLGVDGGGKRSHP